ncbi:MAG: MarR family winged helix-turn-helix transcriptional regulator [Hyphomicrobium sp.]
MGNLNIFDVTGSTIHLLHRAGQRAEELFAKALGEQTLTVRQFIVLSIVEGQENLSQNLICEKTGIDRSTMADIVKRLVTRGWLTRRRSRRDARMYAIRLTELGRKELDRASPVAQRVEGDLVCGLSAKQRQDLNSGLKRITSATMPEAA